jgi:thymidine phosphorylase
VFRIRDLRIDTHSERVFFIHERAVREGNLGFQPLDRIQLVAPGPSPRQINGIVNVCRDALVGATEIGLSEIAFRDLGLPEGTQVEARIARAPQSVDLVRSKLAGETLSRADFDSILRDLVAHRYSKVELSMFVLACGLKSLSMQELIDFTQAMIDCGSRLDFGPGPIADKHCIGGIPGNRTTMVIVPILASLGVTIPKTSSRAITSPAGTADTMAMLADVALDPERAHQVVSKVGGCVIWGGALDLAPADDIMITVERPMEIDTEAQMVASILAKKKTAGATHVLIDVPVGETSKIRSREQAESLASLFRAVARAVGLTLEVVITEARGPIGHGVGPRLEALDVLAVLRGDSDASTSLREKSLFLASRLLESAGAVPPPDGYRVAQRALDSGAALAKLDEIIDAQGRRELPPRATHVQRICSSTDGRIRSLDCWAISKIAKLAGAPAHPAAGVWNLRGVGDVVQRGEPLLEVHSQTESQLQFALEFAAQCGGIHVFGY